MERRLSVVAELEAAVSASLRRARRLRQAILKRAFEGRLIAQEAGDEPAEKMLEKIKAGQSAAESKRASQLSLPGLSRR